jgi:hypothetical protein
MLREQLSDPALVKDRSMGSREIFSPIAVRILSDEGTPNDKLEAARDVYGLFNELAGHPQDQVGVEANPWQTETLLPHGKAINPYSAITCLLDHARTCAFARGVHQAIRAARSRFPGEPVELLYAGTGPFAPLALLQTACFLPDELRLTLIDIHQPALDCLAGILATLGLGDYVEDLLQADATQWVPAGSKTYHILVAEMMDRGLSEEPQVAATMHMVKFLRAGGFVVPEKVELSLCLFDPATEHRLVEQEGSAEGLFTLDRKRQMLGTVFTLTRASADAISVTKDARIILPKVQLPGELLSNGELNILTRITTFGDTCLDEYEAGLTRPLAADLPCGLKPDMGLELCYRLSRNPGLEFQAMETEGEACRRMAC